MDKNNLNGEGEATNLNIIFKALSDPVRRKILALLKERDLTAGEIASFFDISWPSISHHLNILKQAGMVVDERRGQNIYYSINTSVFEDLISYGMEILGKKSKD